MIQFTYRSISPISGRDIMSGISIHKFFAILLAILLFFTGLCTTSFTTQAASTATVGLSCTSKTLEIGDQMYLSAYSSKGGTPTFKSSNSSVASVSRSGKITAKAAGTAKITATIQGTSATCTIYVKRITVDLCTTGIKIEKKGSYRLRATASNYSEITWKSLNPSIATVTSTGVVTGKRPGKATITASAGGTTARCTVTVKKPAIRMSSTSLTLNAGQTLRIVATTSSSMRPVWSSSNTTVATVDQNGTITAHKKGIAIIKATVDGVKGQCVVKVK